jgi:outer membrane protein assembly factor BamB
MRAVLLAACLGGFASAGRAADASFRETFDGLAGSLAPALDESIDPSILGWTHTPPPGWSIDNSRMGPVEGVREWQGWSFTTLPFWTSAATQEREYFTLAQNVFAVADPDEWDDKNSPSASGTFASTLISPGIQVPAGQTTYLYFYSHYRQELNQKAEVRVSFNGESDIVLLHYDSQASSDNGGADAQNREVVLTIPAPPADSTMVIAWALFDAGNNWFWAIDDVRVSKDPPVVDPPDPPVDVKDWPTYLHDNMRTGRTADALDLAQLSPRWTYASAVPPRPAWPGPAKWDAYISLLDLKNMRNYDPVFHIIVVEESLYFGSSSEDCVRCLDTQTGLEKWIFFADGPVRLPPAYEQGKVYFGSDDGCVYCLDAATGSRVWKYQAAPADRLVPNDGKLISLWPVRTGVLVQDGKAYFAASLVPWENSYLCAVDAATGSASGEGLFTVSRTSSTMEGALLASSTRLYVPQGRREPMVFNRSNGAALGVVSGGGGGVFCLLTADAVFVHGPGNKEGWLKENDASTRDVIATIDRGNLMVVSGNVAYVQRGTSLFTLDRTTRRVIWTVACPYTCSLIMAGNHLVMGGNGEVGIFDVENGDLLRTERVDGRAYGLAVAGGMLYVSTDTGTIQAFGEELPGGLQRPGDCNQDGKLDISDVVCLLAHLFGGVPRPLPCEGASIVEGGNAVLLNLNGSALVDIADAVYFLSYLFASGPPPALGIECRPIEGCPDRCVGAGFRAAFKPGERKEP